MKTNEELQAEVENAIKWEPLLTAAEIGVTAKDGVITLTGVVDSYAKKLQAESAAKTVAGVKAVAGKIEIKFRSDKDIKEDNDIANEVLKAFKWNWRIPDGKLKVGVKNGWVTLEGVVEWNFERKAAYNAVKHLLGVKGISNNIGITSEKNHAETEDIEEALNRNSFFNNQNIEVSVSGNNVKLYGRVDSFYAKDEAEQIAWNAPGVSTVDNEIIIVNDYAGLNV